MSYLLSGGAGDICTHTADLPVRVGKSVVTHNFLYQGLEFFADHRMWEAENGPSTKKLSKKAATKNKGAKKTTEKRSQ